MYKAELVFGEDEPGLFHIHILLLISIPHSNFPGRRKSDISPVEGTV